jgi:hypothetical protein
MLAARVHTGVAMKPTKPTGVIATIATRRASHPKAA